MILIWKRIRPEISFYSTVLMIFIYLGSGGKNAVVMLHPTVQPLMVLLVLTSSLWVATAADLIVYKWPKKETSE